MTSQQAVSDDLNNRPGIGSLDVIDATIDPFCWFLSIPIHCGMCPFRTTVTLEKDQMIRNDSGLFGKSISYRPYTALGEIQQGNCLCVSCVDSDAGILFSGCGCNESWSLAVVNELRRRTEAFSAANQLQLFEDIATKSKEVDQKMKAIEQHFEKHPRIRIMTIAER